MPGVVHFIEVGLPEKWLSRDLGVHLAGKRANRGVDGLRAPEVAFWDTAPRGWGFRERSRGNGQPSFRVADTTGAPTARIVSPTSRVISEEQAIDTCISEIDNQ